MCYINKLALPYMRSANIIDKHLWENAWKMHGNYEQNDKKKKVSQTSGLHKKKTAWKHSETKEVCHSILELEEYNHTKNTYLLWQTGLVSTNNIHTLQHSAQKPEARQTLKLSKILLSNLAVQANVDTKVVSHLSTANCFTDVHL